MTPRGSVDRVDGKLASFQSQIAITCNSRWCTVESKLGGILAFKIRCFLVKPAQPMLSTPWESVQICTDPDRQSRIFRKLTRQKTVLKLKLVE